MVHSNRQARSVSGSRSLASDGFLAPDATGTQNSHLQTKSPSSHTKPKPISAYFLPNLPLAISTTTASIAGCNELSGDAARSLPIDAGRPPSRILDSGSGALQEHINGVVTGVELIKDDVAALADASATTFDRAITKNAAPPTKDKDKRVLRSQDNSSRPRSNLARFFPDFEEVVFGTPTEPGTLTNAMSVHPFVLTVFRAAYRFICPLCVRKQAQNQADDSGIPITTESQRDWERLEGRACSR